MKKYISILIMLMIFPSIVFAANDADIINNCESENDASCAFCVYKYKEDFGCYIDFSVTYKDNNTPLVYKVYSSGSNTGYVNCTFKYNNFLKNDFKNANGDIVCPNVNPNSQITSSSGRTAYKTLTLSSNSSGSLAPSSESSVKIINNITDNNDNNHQNKETYICSYSGGACEAFTVSVINNVVYVDSSLPVWHSLTSNIFSNGSCPTLYTYYNTRGEEVCSISSTNQPSFVPAEGSLVNQGTGEIIEPDDSDDSSDYLGSNINYNNLCGEENVIKAMKIIGYVVLIAKWVVPLIIIVLGMIDFGKATTSSDEQAVSKATAALIRRFVAGIIIFFIPTIMLAVLDIIEVTGGIEDPNNSQFGACTRCIFDVSKCS